MTLHLRLNNFGSCMVISVQFMAFRVQFHSNLQVLVTIGKLFKAIVQTIRSGAGTIGLSCLYLTL